DDPAVWAGLPGVGRYILGAVLSQAFDRRIPIVEANSQRVLCRLFGQSGDPKSGRVKKWLWETAERLRPTRRAGDFNQGLIELGALVCTPSGPGCGKCPLAKMCTANRDGLQEVIPLRAKKPVVTQVRETAVIVRRADTVLLVRRPARGRWSNMWEFPHAELSRSESHPEAAARVLEDLTGVSAKVGREWLTVRHTVTRFRITLVCLEAKYRAGEFCSDFYTEGRWVKPIDLRQYPVSSPQRRLAESLIAGPRQNSLL